jgi:hypothetical protein
VHQFWLRFILPIILQLAPRQIMEVGAEFGWNTRGLLDYCREAGARLHVIDPVLHPDLAATLADFGEEYVYIQGKSLDSIPAAPAPDLVLLDGDHNWYTINAELHLLYRRAAEAGVPPPVALMHDCAWPYARRDMYYDPETLNGSQRHLYAYLGCEVGRSELSEDGMNGHLANAQHEGGPRNGVLTGVEDFIAEVQPRATLHVLPYFNGMGILVPQARSTRGLQTLIASFTQGESLLQTAKELEESHMRARVENAQLVSRFTRRTEALVRARTLLAERAEEIVQLRREQEGLRAELEKARAELERKQAAAEPVPVREPLA